MRQMDDSVKGGPESTGLASSEPDAAAGRDRWVAEAYRRFGPALRRFLRRHRASFHEAEDLTQDAYARFYALQEPARIANPKAYLYRTALNLLVDLRRRQKVRAAHDVTLETVAPPVDATVEADSEQEYRLRALHVAISALPPRCREVFILQRYRGWSHRRIAETLGISVHAVEKHVVRALKRCQESVRYGAATPSNSERGVGDQG